MDAASTEDGGDATATPPLAPLLPASAPSLPAPALVDNFAFARHHVERVLGDCRSTPELGYYLPVTVLLRRKDVPQLPGKDTSVLVSKNVRNMESLERLAPVVRAVCDATNARFYMKLNKRDDKSVAAVAMQGVVASFVAGNYRAAGKAFASAVGSKKSPGAPSHQKFFMLDVDPTGEEDVPAFLDAAERAIRECWARRRQPAHDVDRVPSKSGVHVVCPAFDKMLFTELMRGQPKIWDLREDALVLIYFSGRGKLEWG